MQVQFFQTWCKELVVKYPTLVTLPPIHKERIFVSYALEISQVRNIKNLTGIGVKSVNNYRRVSASHTTDNGQFYPIIWYTPNVLPFNSAKPFPILKKFISHMSKWSDGMDEYIRLATTILRDLEACSSSGFPLLKRHVSLTPSA